MKPQAVSQVNVVAITLGTYSHIMLPGTGGEAADATGEALG